MFDLRSIRFQRVLSGEQDRRRRGRCRLAHIDKSGEGVVIAANNMKRRQVQVEIDHRELSLPANMVEDGWIDDMDAAKGPLNQRAIIGPAFYRPRDPLVAGLDIPPATE